MARDAHKDRRFNFVPGCGLVFKREAGLPVDRMVSYLVELEYLRTDDLTEFEEVLRQVIAGKSVWSMQRTESEMDYYAGYFEAPDEDEEPEEFQERTPEEIDAYGDIIAFLMGDIEEIPIADDAPITADDPLNCVESTSKGGDTMPLTAKRDLKYHPAAIRARLAKLPPYKRETVKRLILETLHAMERKRGIDLTAEIQAVSDA